MSETDAFAAALMSQLDADDEDFVRPLPPAQPALDLSVLTTPLPEATNPLPDLPPAPNAADLIDDSTPIEKQITKLVETDALHAAGVAITLGQRLAEMAMLAEDIEEVRKAYATFTARSDLVEKRKVVTSTQAPLTIVFERGATENVKIDVRRGAEMQRLRDAAAAASDATPA
jgi:hypothetical protein